MKHLEFENGKLVKIYGMRPEHLDGNRLMDLVKELAQDMLTQLDTLQGEIDEISMNLGKSLLDNAALSRGFETYGWTMQFTCPHTGRKGAPAITLDPEEARDMMGRDNWTVTEIFTIKAPRPAAAPHLAPEPWEGSDAHPEGGAV